MEFEIEVKNYRCFSDNFPARLIIKPGFSALLGANNSGKSSLLRLFYELRPVFASMASLNGVIHLSGLSWGLPVTDPSQIFCNKNSRDMIIVIKPRTYEPIDPLFPLEISLLCERKSLKWHVVIRTKDNTFDFRTAGATLVNDIGIYANRESGKREPAINVLPFRTLMNDLATCLYIGPFRNAINTGTNTSYYDINVGQAFIKRWREIKTGEVAADNEAAFQLTQHINHIFSYDSLEINPSRDDTTLQIFINGRSFKLEEVGAGLTQFILVLANAAIKKPSYILVDEPELNLHPSLQLDFLTTLGSYANRGVIYATHNIGLARSSADQIYSLRQKGDGISEVRPLESTPRLAELVGELSYSGYRELGFKKILLVEGVNEIKTVQQFLRMLKKDHQIVLLPLGGSQLINATREEELLEVTRISPDVFALIDSERKAKNDKLDDAHQGFVDLCKRIGIDCHILERRTFENYFTNNAVKSFLGNKYRALQPYELLGDLPNGWAKSSNWQIARRMKFEDIQDTDLGKFLARL